MKQVRHIVVSRDAFTLIELVVAVAAASLLMAGLASCLAISMRAFDGSPAAAVRSNAAEVQAEMLTDLREATSFSNRQASEVTFNVPDRDSDGNEETITYRWLAGTKELAYSMNGSAEATLLENVTNFNLGYTDRSQTGCVSPPAPFDPNDWGNRWASPFSTVGYDTQFTESSEIERAQIGTLVTLTEGGTVENIVFYLDVPNTGTQIAAAIYDVDNSSKPGNLIVASGIESDTGDGWQTVPVTPTHLVAGDYYLVLSYEARRVKHFYDSGGSGSIEIRTHNPFTEGWESPWGNPSATSSGTLSIYAEYRPD